jgi:hypothetical protein
MGISVEKVVVRQIRVEGGLFVNCFNDDPIVAFEWLPRPLRFLEVPDSDLCPKIGCAVVFMAFFSRSRQILGHLKAACDNTNIISNLLFVNVSYEPM